MSPWATAQSPCASSHKGVFYANDFSYLSDPNYDGACFGDLLKQNELAGGQLGTYDIGGQLRLRQHSELGMGREVGDLNGFGDTNNDFLLTRLRLYTNWQATENVRFFGELINANLAADESYVPRAIDEDPINFLNLFFDTKLTDETTFRIGRQELLYGAQRTVSPLDWANTRRTFEGIKVIHKEGDWAVDGFFTAFVPPQADEWDTADWQQQFYGCYGTYSGAKNAVYDFYYLGYDNRQTYQPGKDAPGSRDFSLHTFGGRMLATQDAWLFEVEGALQTGRQSGLGLDQRAAFVTGGVGRNFDVEWSPTLWFYYDYATGNDGNGAWNRYNQLFPLAHKYLGFIDSAQRSNISSPNCLLTAAPADKLSLLFWYYYLGAAQAGDIVPGVGFNTDQNTTSRDFGHELDTIVQYQICPRSNILFGYSHLWRGEKIIGTRDADFFYTQWETNF
ncbi:alginate export family protein [Pirellulimonas nuda]|uniref:alginate export family protein n=1 Tax=Pirellulimonas nuda TaxID=2528009 RepID=UPI0018D42A59|nr:alginate export family protein [Pirellulimonas nuda]